MHSAENKTTRLADLFQEGCLKVRLPRSEGDGDIDIALMNTAGGLTGGDAISIEVVVDAGARATVTTPACERIYRSIGGDAVIRQRLHVGPDSRLDWLPQETILFDQGRLKRRLDVELLADAEITLCEAILLGRAAMGETVKSGSVSEFWTVRRDGRLLFADAMRISEPFGQAVACPTSLGGNPALASLVHVGRDLEAKRDALRSGFSAADTVVAGASIIDDVLVARIVAPSGSMLRGALIPALLALRDNRPLPRNWFC